MVGCKARVHARCCLWLATSETISRKAAHAAKQASPRTTCGTQKGVQKSSISETELMSVIACKWTRKNFFSNTKKVSNLSNVWEDVYISSLQKFSVVVQHKYCSCQMTVLECSLLLNNRKLVFCELVVHHFLSLNATLNFSTLLPCAVQELQMCVWVMQRNALKLRCFVLI